MIYLVVVKEEGELEGIESIQKKHIEEKEVIRPLKIIKSILFKIKNKIDL